MALHDPHRNLLFIHIYRTGGNTFREVFARPPKTELGSPHCVARDVAEAYPGAWRRAYRVSIVRHPLDWLLSTWKLIRQSPGHQDHALPQTQRFDDFLRWAADETAKFAERTPLVDHYATQVQFLHDDRGTLLVHYVARHEQLVDELIRISERIGEPWLRRERDQIPVKRPSRDRRPRTDYYTGADVTFVERVWARDFEVFGYE